jgi:hypothetical protein
VYTRHTSSKSGSALSSGSTVRERTLHIGDAVYALGQLSVEKTSDGETVKWLRAPNDGRQLLVSNIDEGSLMLFSKLWFGTGVTVFALSAILLAWSFHQRYGVIFEPR